MAGPARAPLFAALGPLLLAACVAQQSAPEASGPAPEASGPVPVSIRLVVVGDTGPVLDGDGAGQLELTRRGAGEPVSMAFANDALAVEALPPGRYEVSGLGALRCRGLAFEVGGRPRHLGTVRANLVDASYHVALMSRASVSSADVAEVAERAGTVPDAVDAVPIEITETAPCYLGRDGPITTWEDLPLEEQIMLGIGMAGLCALALASGGFCAFGG